MKIINKIVRKLFIPEHTKVYWIEREHLQNRIKELEAYLSLLNRRLEQ